MQPLVIAHRGAPCERPEHTGSSYRIAIRRGADLVEPDVVPTRDGVLLVRHESGLASTTDIALRPRFADRRRSDASGASEWFAEDFDWEELRDLRAVERLPELRPRSAAHSGAEPPLRLRELVRIVTAEAEARGRRCGIVVELKYDARSLALGFDYAELLARELEGLAGLDALRDLRVESFEEAALDRLRGAGCGAARILLIETDAARAPEEAGERWLTPDGLDEAARRFDGISLRASLLGVDTGHPEQGRELVAAAHARGLEVLAYTFRPEDEFLPERFRGRPAEYRAALLGTGIDGLFTDEV